MRRVDDYSDEMGPFAISDSDVERILRGRAPHGPGLSRLVAMVDELRAERDRNLRPELVSRHVAMAVAAASDGYAAEQVATESLAAKTVPAPAARTPRLQQLIPRLGTSLATLVLFIGLTGVAVASDDAIPGDTLHGFDLALEKIGVGAGGTEERIAEAKELAIGGLPVEALDYVSSALSNGQDEASRALKDAVKRLETINAADSQAKADRDEVAEMLDWMASADKGKDFGKGVAERAQELGKGEADLEPAGRAVGNTGKGNRGKGR